MQRTMERLEREMRDQIAEVRRQYSAELVPYEATSGELIPRTWISRG
jgi:phage host-nuclease inhibitor protein Gam